VRSPAEVAAMPLLGRGAIVVRLTILAILATGAISQDEMEVSDPELNTALKVAEEQQERREQAGIVQAHLIKRASTVTLWSGTGDISTTGALTKGVQGAGVDLRVHCQKLGPTTLQPMGSSTTGQLGWDNRCTVT
jgi:hypothetical protein